MYVVVGWRFCIYIEWILFFFLLDIVLELFFLFCLYIVVMVNDWLFLLLNDDIYWILVFVILYIILVIFGIFGFFVIKS